MSSSKCEQNNYSAGTNNLGKTNPFVIAKSIIQCVTSIRELCPHAEVLVIGILPRTAKELSDHECTRQIKLINSTLKLKLTLICHYHEPNCQLRKHSSVNTFLYKNDNIHLNNEGYRKLLDDIRWFTNKNTQNTPTLMTS